jgi:hypothetical protein
MAVTCITCGGPTRPGEYHDCPKYGAPRTSGYQGQNKSQSRGESRGKSKDESKGTARGEKRAGGSSKPDNRSSNRSDSRKKSKHSSSGDESAGGNSKSVSRSSLTALSAQLVAHLAATASGGGKRKGGKRARTAESESEYDDVSDSSRSAASSRR